MEELGRLCKSIPSDAVRLTAEARRPGSRIRVGFISRFFRNHTIGELMRGLIAGLNREIFEVTVLSVGAGQDEASDFLRLHADHYVELPSNLSAARQLVEPAPLALARGRVRLPPGRRADIDRRRG